MKTKEEIEKEFENEFTHTDLLGFRSLSTFRVTRGDSNTPYNGTNKANSLTTVQTDSMVEQDTVIRKLTPTECERLQGMPDNWTNPTGDISNSQRYKMCGNAFNVDVVSWILSFIIGILIGVADKLLR